MLNKLPNPKTNIYAHHNNVRPSRKSNSCPIDFDVRRDGRIISASFFLKSTKTMFTITSCRVCVHIKMWVERSSSDKPSAIFDDKIMTIVQEAVLFATRPPPAHRGF